MWNNWRQWFNGTTIFAREYQRKIIGYAWGTAAIDGAVSSSLSFEVGQDPVKVGGSVNVKARDNYSGNTGPNENMDPVLGNGMEPGFNINRVSAYYVSPHEWIWDGSQDFQGNTAQALYEWPEQGDPAGYWGRYDGSWVMRAICSRPAGLDCPEI